MTLKGKYDAVVDGNPVNFKFQNPPSRLGTQIDVYKEALRYKDETPKSTKDKEGTDR